ncbi:uncharacterized protein TRAVEDRAFT_130193 [Trametes versicolor FP-101664 SS1]|uniref:uncharacterized protein n=1 Tax=Trametes versicolor (strain FP-101664) TaxID=717944 RepID=UPI00046247AB|nr:uncharacterized protein TRAVEDRAFT_130193 [Trametes versicolor FP-101664 SS1]EIW55950.1 hypothetical protein TRAVEDRAFT_130193 [Trametes versicolor FP-101664 SS1]
MFSFSTIAIFATFALSAVTSAIPHPGQAGELNAVPVAAAVAPRATQDSLASIFADAQSQLLPFTNQLKFATTQNATVEGLTPSVNGIKNVLTTSTTRVHGLAGLPVKVILASLDGTLVLTAVEVAHLLAAVSILVFEAVGAVITLLHGGIAPAVFLLLVGVGELVGTLLKAVTVIVGAVLVDLTVILVPLLAGVVGIIRTLGLTVLLALLGL